MKFSIYLSVHRKINVQFIFVKLNDLPDHKTFHIFNNGGSHEATCDVLWFANTKGYIKFQSPVTQRPLLVYSGKQSLINITGTQEEGAPFYYWSIELRVESLLRRRHINNESSSVINLRDRWSHISTFFVSSTSGKPPVLSKVYICSRKLRPCPFITLLARICFVMAVGTRISCSSSYVVVLLSKWISLSVIKLPTIKNERFKTKGCDNQNYYRVE